MSKIEYPKMKFAKSKEAECGYESVIVQNKAEEEALAKGYEDSPAKFGIVTHPNPIEEREMAAKAKADAEAKKGDK